LENAKISITAKKCEKNPRKLLPFITLELGFAGVENILNVKI